MNDPYEAALGVLRGQAPSPAPDQAEMTRQRVLATLRARQVRRRRSAAALAVAACFVFSTAFAYYVWARSGARDGRAAERQRDAQTRGAPASALQKPSVARGAPPVRAVAEVPAEAAQERSTAAHARDERHPPAASQASRVRRDASSGVSAPAPVQRARPEVRGEEAARERKPARAAAALPAGSERPRIEPVREQLVRASAVPARSAAELDALYLSAHQLHFRGSPSRALAAWDAYLAAQPQGPLAVEARYNRAVVLARLGRLREAREALAPFARGDFGDFRSADARELWKRIGDR